MNKPSTKAKWFRLFDDGFVAFFVRFFGILWGSSIFIDLKYGGPNWGTVLIGIVFAAFFIYWQKGKSND